jgi:hypothetical protein
MSFGESVFSAEINQKTSKVDLYARDNYAILSRNQRGKVLEVSRGHHAKAEAARWG